MQGEGDRPEEAQANVYPRNEVSKMTLKEELEALEAEKRVIEEKIQDCYRRSLEAKEGDKLVVDFLAEDLAERPPREPQNRGWQVDRVKWAEGVKYFQRHYTSDHDVWVSVRPVDKECEGKTYLGVLIGSAPLGVRAVYDGENRILHLKPSFHNPCIWIPDLERIVFGAGSWWAPVESPEDLRKITDTDIENVWYVRALKSLERGK